MNTSLSLLMLVLLTLLFSFSSHIVLVHVVHASGEQKSTMKSSLSIPMLFPSSPSIAGNAKAGILCVESNINFKMDPSKIGQGLIQSVSDICTLSDFQSKSQYDKIKNVSSVFHNVTDNTNKNFDHVVVCKTAWGLKDTNSSKFDNYLKNNKTYLDQTFANDKYTSSESSEQISKVCGEYSGVLEKKFPSFFQDSTGQVKWDFKKISKLNPAQQKAILDITKEIGAFPSKVEIFAGPNPKVKDTSKFLNLGITDHPYFKGSQSITLYFDLNNQKDTLVINYLVTAFKAPAFMWAGLLKKGSSIFLKDITDTVIRYRNYFASTSAQTSPETSTQTSTSNKTNVSKQISPIRSLFKGLFNKRNNQNIQHNQHTQHNNDDDNSILGIPNLLNSFYF
ncbi:MAG: hypothetical protein HQK49_19300 [Oligoflexia bacterium]|nr:hypothetical protein [Oligoflexia bacterium]